MLSFLLSAFFWANSYEVFLPSLLLFHHPTFPCVQSIAISVLWKLFHLYTRYTTRTPRWNKMLKKLSEKKYAVKALSKTDYHLTCNPRIPRHKSCRSGSKNFQRTLLGKVWPSIGFKLFMGKQSIWQIICRLHGEKLKCHNLYKGFNWEHSQGWKGNPSTTERILFWFVKPSKTAPSYRCDKDDFGKKEIFTLTEMAAARWALKSGEAADAD